MRDHPILLGVNVDHVATLRQARGTRYPDPIQAAYVAEQAGADSITIHLREDRRHIQDRDLSLLSQTIGTRINLECAITQEMIDIAIKHQPADVCLVPEKREELTTEGGLDVLGQIDEVKSAVKHLSDAGIRVSLFIDPEPKQLQAAIECNAPVVELHTGTYADAQDASTQKLELERIINASVIGYDLGLVVNAGHGLHYHNVQPVAAIPQIEELNIGHAIIARAVMSGLDSAVREMKRLMRESGSYLS